MRVGAQHSHQTFNLARVFDAGMDGACRRVHGEFGGVLKHCSLSPLKMASSFAHHSCLLGRLSWVAVAAQSLHKATSLGVYQYGVFALHKQHLSSMLAG